MNGEGESLPANKQTNYIASVIFLGYRPAVVFISCSIQFLVSSSPRI